MKSEFKNQQVPDRVLPLLNILFFPYSFVSFLTGFSNLAERYMGYKEIRKAKEGRRWFSYCTKGWICHSVASKMLSVSYDQLNMTMLPVILDHVSQGSSSKVAYHFAQVCEHTLQNTAC